MIVDHRSQFGEVLNTVHDFGTAGWAGIHHSSSHFLTRGQFTLEDGATDTVAFLRAGIATALVTRLK